MFNVCTKCGEYHADKIIDLKENVAKCPNCGENYKFKRLPLFIITGASGVGKSTVCIELANMQTNYVVMDSDILWREEFNKPEDDYKNYREMWLRVCKNISQVGKPVVLIGSSIPEQFENCIERRYFSNLYHIALVCDEKSLITRLKERPKYRNCSSDDFIKGHIEFNNWFKNNKGHIMLIDTTSDSVQETARKINTLIIENYYTDINK